MAVNPFFNKFDAANEQDLWEDLIVESIQIYGIDVKYVVRTMDNKDKVFGQDDLETYSDTYSVEMYIEDVFGFTGDRSFMSKLAGLEIRDQVKFVVARRQFGTFVGTPAGLSRPREGDLIYFPLNNKCFQIKYVESKPYFYPLGQLQTYRLECELYEYSSEQFDTNDASIDRINELSLDNILNVEETDPHADNETLQDEAEELLQFNPNDPFSEGRL